MKDVEGENGRRVSRRSARSRTFAGRWLKAGGAACEHAAMRSSIGGWVLACALACTPAKRSVDSPGPAAATVPAAPVAATKPAPPTSKEARMDVRLEAMTEHIKPRFSADGQHFAADVYRDDGHVLVLDGQEVARSDRHFIHVELAPDGSWISYAQSVLEPGKNASGRLVHRGVISELAGEPVALAVTPDGAHVAVGISRGGGDEGAVLLDGKQLARAVSPRMLTLSNDGKRWAYAETISHRTGGETVTIDGVKSEPMHAAWGLTFSPDGKHVAYQSVIEKKRGVTAAVVVDGKPGKVWQRTSGRLQFTADGKVVYEAADSTGSWLVVGEQAYGPYRSVYGPTVSGSRVAWAGETLAGRTTVLHVLLDGKPVWGAELGQFSPMNDRWPSVRGLVIAGDKVAFGADPGVEKGHWPDAWPVHRGEVLATDALGAGLAVRHRGGAGQTLEVQSMYGDVEVPGSPPMVEVFGETLRLTGQEVHYFARTATQLVFVRAPAVVVRVHAGP